MSMERRKRMGLWFWIKNRSKDSPTCKAIFDLIREDPPHNFAGYQNLKEIFDEIPRLRIHLPLLHEAYTAYCLEDPSW